MNYNIKEVLEKAQKYSGELTAIRRTIHRFPELGFEEFRTTETIKEYLIKIPGMKILPLSSPTGVIAELPGKSNKTVALRADIDALEIEEKNIQ